VNELLELSRFRQRLLYISTQLQLYKAEVEHCTRNRYYGDVLFGTLIYLEQPFPAPIKQGINAGTIELKLVTGAKSKIPESAQVVAELTNPNNTRLCLNIEGGTALLNGDTVEFNGLKFSSGSQCKEVTLTFSLTIRQNRITSPESSSFIVITNTKQWLDAQYQLLKTDLFKNRPEISFCEFCNTLQKHFLRASLQLTTVERPITTKDFEYLCKCVMSKDLVSPVIHKDFDRLWSWFGPVMRNIRYEPGLRQFWVNGLFWGFLTTAEAEELLKHRHPGCFLLRFSTSVNGGIVVTYKQSRTQARHYLIKRQGTLEDFLRSQLALTKFLKVETQDSNDIITVIEKETAFAMLGLKKKPQKLTEKKQCSYDIDMHPLHY